MRKAKKAILPILVAAMLLSLMVVASATGDTRSYPGAGKLADKTVNFTVEADPAKPVPAGDHRLVTFHIFVESVDEVPVQVFSFNLEPSEGLELADTIRSNAQEANFYYDYPTPGLRWSIDNSDGEYKTFDYSNYPGNPRYFAAAGSDEGKGITTKTEVFTIVGKVTQAGTYVLNLTNVIAGDGNAPGGVANEFRKVVTPASVTVGEIAAKMTVSGTAVSWNSIDDAVYYLYPAAADDETIRAEWKNGSCTGVACSSRGSITVNADGKRHNQTFSFAGVPYNDYKLVICKPGKYVPKIVPVAANEENIDMGEMKLWLYGDVNYDGKVNGTDAAQIQRFYANKIPNILVSGNEQDIADKKLCADVSRDGKINGTDSVQIQRYYANKTPNIFTAIK